MPAIDTALIQAEIDGLLIALKYADPNEKPLIEAELNGLRIAMDYA
jgi:hypothetical protein